MDRSWMYCMRTTVEYLNGVEEFMRCAEQHRREKRQDKISCPCVNCFNRRWWDSDIVREHLILSGFNPSYTTWIWHSETVIQSTMAESSTSIPQHNVEDDDNIDDNELEEYDRLEEMLRDVQEDFEERLPVFNSLFRDNTTPLYPGCSKYTKLSAVFKLLNMKAKFGVSDKCFTTLLETFADMLPDENECPTSTYEAKKMLCPLNLQYERIHACPNDCVLYRGEYESADKSPTCDAWRYKRKDKVGGAPAKVLWYLPIVSRFKRLFSNTEDAKLLRWHDEERKKDGKLRHPADSPQWRNIDTLFPEFGSDVRNLRLGLCTDGINPNGDMSSRHSTWPVLLCIYNLPLWLSMKRKYIMLSLLISGPKQPGNDNDVYLAPLIDDLNTLWHEWVKVYDAYTRSRFNLRAMILCTINDFPAYGNLSGYNLKGRKACPICGDNTDSQWLNNCKKHVYMGHRKFLPRSHESN